jgi:PAS domain S-box-containing protein
MDIVIKSAYRMQNWYFPENLGKVILKLTMKNPYRAFLFLVECLLLVVCPCVTAVASDVLQVRGDESYYPFEFLDADQRPAGFNVDIITSVARKMGLAIEIEVGPWHEVRRQIEQGDIDILMGMSKSAERDALVDFSIPHFVSSFAVFVPQGSSITALDQISGKTVLVQQGGTGHDYLLNLDSVEQIIPVKTVAEALRGLKDGQGECALLPRLQAMVVIHAQGWDELFPVGEPVLQRGYCFAVPEGRSGLLALLNEGLSIIKDSGEYDTIYEKWLGVYEPVKKDYQRVIRYAALGFALLIVCVGIVVLWNRLLKKKVVRMVRQLSENRERLRTTLDSMWEGVVTTDQDGLITNMNLAAEQLTGWKRVEVNGRHIDDVFTTLDARDRKPLPASVSQVLAIGKPIESPDAILLVARDGSEYHTTQTTTPLRDEKGTTHGVVLVFRDVTEEQALQEQLHQSQKMEAIGQLAGGVAHDFNNMLSGIMGAAEVLKEGGGAGAANRDRYLDLILQSASRAKDLTWKLLAFGRKEGLVAMDVDLHEIMDDTLAIIGSTMDKRITTIVRKQADNAWVHANGSALQNAFLNLLLNGIQAMPRGGELRIETRNVDLDREYCAASTFELNPGLHVELRVSDTGIGIPSENVHKLFEPFFTTKPQGKGTGLGLAAVYGTITGNHGEILVSSTTERGTIFQILLPCVPEPECVQKIQEPHVTGSGTILLVDDEESILDTEQTLLEDMGYRVISAANGKEAVNVFTARHQEIDVVVMDMRMPEMDGHEAFIRMKEIDPACKVIIASGFANMGKDDEEWVNALAGFLRKPYRVCELNKLIIDVLG